MRSVLLKEDNGRADAQRTEIREGEASTRLRQNHEDGLQQKCEFKGRAAEMDQSQY